MKTLFIQKQHEKCLAVIEMIQNCEKIIGNCKSNLARLEKMNWIDRMPGSESWNEKQIVKYRAIKQRLILYYSNQFMKLVEPIAETMAE